LQAQTQIAQHKRSLEGRGDVIVAGVEAEGEGLGVSKSQNKRKEEGDKRKVKASSFTFLLPLSSFLLF
jgi:hypothetical protein